MDIEYGKRYADLYRRHWWWRVREAAVLQELRRLQPAAGWRRLLDVGCGDGLFFDRLSEFGEIEGVEPDIRLLDPTGKWRDVIHAVPFDQKFQPGHCFDVILMLDVLEHLEEPLAALRHALSLLSPGGFVVITVPVGQWLWTYHDDFNRHVQRFSRGSFRALASSAGLAITRERFLFQWLVPAKLVVRFMEAIGLARPRPVSVPAAPLNGLLTALTRAEIALAARVPFPVGSSLLVIGVPMAAPQA